MAEKYISQFTGQEIDERLASVSEKYGENEFKRAVGNLLKSGKIEITEKSIRKL